jgi:hypothetical protein
MEKYISRKENIQDIFPELSKEDRERLLTGICPHCWNVLFNQEEETML